MARRLRLTWRVCGVSFGYILECRICTKIGELRKAVHEEGSMFVRSGVAHVICKSTRLLLAIDRG